MKKIILILLTVTIFASCKKKEPPVADPLPPPDTSGDINTFFTKNYALTQVFTIASASAQTIVGTKGTTITIPASAFKTKSGGVTILGNYEVSLMEVYGKKEMILNKAQSATIDDLLITAGQIKITAKQGDEDLMLIAPKTITISYPVTSTPGTDMMASYGDPNYLTSNISWMLDSIGVDNSAIPVITPFSYQLVSDSIEWVGCSKPITSPNPKTNFTITLHGNYNNTNTQIFITSDAWAIFNILNAAIKMTMRPLVTSLT